MKGTPGNTKLIFHKACRAQININDHTERNLTNNTNKHPEPEAKNWQAGALLKPNTTHCLSLC